MDPLRKYAIKDTSVE